MVFESKIEIAENSNESPVLNYSLKSIIDIFSVENIITIFIFYINYIVRYTNKEMMIKICNKINKRLSILKILKEYTNYSNAVVKLSFKMCKIIYENKYIMVKLSKGKNY